MASMYDTLFADVATQAIRYDADETNPAPVSLVVSSYQAVKTRREASKSTIGELAPGTAITSGQLLRQGTRWYLVSDVLDESPVLLAQVNVRTLLLPLPYVITVERAVALDVGVARRFDNSGAPLVPAPATDASLVTTTTTIRAALSTDYNLRQDSEGGAGPVITALVTLLVPLGARVSEGDIVNMPDGTGATARYRVANKATAQGSGQVYGWQLILHDMI